MLAMNMDSINLAARIIIALDVPGYDEAAALVETLDDAVSFYKVGLEMYIHDGDRLLDFLRAAGKDIFLDLKLHDIPNTVKRAAAAIAHKGVQLATVHASGGREMLAAAAAGVAGSDVRLLGVTVLTSISEEILRDDIGVTRPLRDQVSSLALAASGSGLDGIVCSPQELTALRETLPPDFLIVTPGIRPAWAAAGDQKRVMTPRDAFALGASYIVIGRPVTESDNPLQAARRIHEELAI